MSGLLFPLTALGAVLERREPYTSVIIDEAASGKEIRSTWWTYPRYRYNVRFEMLRSDARADHQLVVNFFSRAGGPFSDFLIIDPEDNTVTDHGFGVGDGSTTAFQLQRTQIGAAYGDQLGTYTQSSKPRTNRVLQSQSLTVAPWAATNAIVTDNAAIAPDGTATATVVNEGTVAGVQHYVSQPPVLVAGTRYTVSVFVKAGSNTTCKFGWNDGAGLGVFDLVNGVVTTPPSGAGTASIAAAPGGWWRITVGYTAAASGALDLLLLCRDGSVFTGTSNTFFAWGVQLELGSVATQYIPTTSAAVTVNPTYWPAQGDGFEPIFDLNGPISVFLDNDWRGKRQLFPWQRTNVATFSEQADNAAWGKSAVTVTADNTAAPDGNTTADRINVTAGSANHFISVAGTSTSRTGTFTASVYAKAGTVSTFWMELSSGVQGVVQFTLTGAGTATAISGSPGSTITALPNGWYRCTATFSVAAAGTSVNLFLGAYGTFAAAGTETIFFWGGQLEQSSVPTEYIPTPSSAAVSKTDYTLSSTGLVTLTTAPLANAWLSATMNYFRRVRFEQPSLGLDRIVANLWSQKGVGLISVKT